MTQTAAEKAAADKAAADRAAAASDRAAAASSSADSNAPLSTAAQKAARDKANAAAADSAAVDEDAALKTAEVTTVIEGVQVAYDNHVKSLHGLASQLASGKQITSAQVAAILTAAESIGKTLAGLTPGMLDQEVPL